MSQGGPVIRQHVAGAIRSEAVYSGCERFRYALTRLWDDTVPRLAFVLLNPSTASELRNDPTVARCQSRAQALGYGGFRVVNLFAYRATLPSDLRAAADPMGPDADAVLAEAADWADAVICGWGNHGALNGRAAQGAALLRRTGRPLFHLGLTVQGQPRHPLYVASAFRPERW